MHRRSKATASDRDTDACGQGNHVEIEGRRKQGSEGTPHTDTSTWERYSYDTDMEQGMKRRAEESRTIRRRACSTPSSAPSRHHCTKQKRSAPQRHQLALAHHKHPRVIIARSSSTATYRTSHQQHAASQHTHARTRSPGRRRTLSHSHHTFIAVTLACSTYTPS
jgi:hypothetical protein